MNAQDSLDNPIGQNVITPGVFTDGKKTWLNYHNQNSAYVPAVRQLFCAFGSAGLIACDHTQNRSLTCGNLR